MKNRKVLLIMIFLGIACALPFFISNYRTFQLTLVLV